MKKIAAIMADGFEEGEALFTVDIFRRAGFTCDMLAIRDEIVDGAHGIQVKADRLLGDGKLEDYDLIFLPGGLPGAPNMRDDERVISLVQAFDADPDKYVAAICAAPIVLAKADIVRGRKVTSNPGQAVVDAVKGAGANYQDDCLTAVDGHLITSRGPATLFPFAFTIVDMLGGDSAALKSSMLYDMLEEDIRKA